ncbi:hypothetical protein SVIOM342S_05661 [Streptomyces violaceorubidus]
MTTLPRTCRPAWSSTARRIRSTGKPAATGTRSGPAATGRAISGRAPRAAFAPLAAGTPSTCAATVQMRPSGTPSSLAACTVSVPWQTAKAGRLLTLLTAGLRPPARPA